MLKPRTRIVESESQKFKKKEWELQKTFEILNWAIKLLAIGKKTDLCQINIEI